MPASPTARAPTADGPETAREAAVWGKAGAPAPALGIRTAALAGLACTISTLAFVLSIGAPSAAAALLAFAAAATSAWPRPADPASPPALALVWGAGAGWMALLAGAGLDPIVEAGFRCGTGDLALVILGAPLVAGGSATAFLVARKVLGARVGRRGAGGTWALRMAWLLGLALVAGAAARRASHVSPDAYLASLPVTARLPTAADVPCERVRGPGGATSCVGRVADVGPLRAAYDCPTDGAGGCTLEVTPRSEDAGGARGQSEIYVRRDEEVVVRRDDRAGLFFLESNGVAQRAVRDDGSLLFYLGPADVRHAVGAPTGWLVLGAAGLAGAAALAWLARTRRRAADRLSGARAGLLGAHGWIELADGAPPAFAAPVPWVGPVTLLGPAESGGYRSAPQATRVLRGSPIDLAAGERAWERSAHYAAVAVLLLSLAPLLAALRLGLAL